MSLNAWNVLAATTSLVDLIPPENTKVTLQPDDIVRKFTAPNGREVKVIVQMPHLVGRAESPYKMRPIQANELADCYFPLAVHSAVQAGAHILVFPKGTYEFHHPLSGSINCLNGEGTISAGAAHWTIQNVKDLQIEGSGSTLNFNHSGYGVQVKSSQRLIIRGFNIDWPNLMIASHGRIQAPLKGESDRTLRVDDQYPMSSSTVIEALNIWDDKNETWLGSQSVNEVYFNTLNCGVSTYGFNGPNTCYQYRGGQVFSSKYFNRFPEGTSVLLRHTVYDGFAFNVNSSNDIDLEDINIITGPGMGFVVDNDDPNSYAHGFRFSHCSVKRGPQRLISTAADAFHVSAIQGDVILENNDFGDNGDDVINIQGLFQPVVSANDRSVTLAASSYASVGDTLGFFNFDREAHLNLGFLGSAKVAASTSSDKNLSLTMDQSVSGLSPSLLAINLSRRASVRYYLENNKFHNNRGDGIVVRSIYGLIDKNYLSNNTRGGITLYVGAIEGPSVDNVIVSNNTVVDPGQVSTPMGGISIFVPNKNFTFVTRPVNSNILVSNNTVQNTYGPAYLVASAQNVRLINNTAIAANQNPRSVFTFGSAHITDSVIVYGAHNVQICGQKNRGTTGGPIGIDRGSTDFVSVDGPSCK